MPDPAAFAAALPLWFWVATFGALGLIIGSFIATLCLRWPDGRSVLRGRSTCDGCGRVLNAGELVPLVSALASRGRCRSCGAPIAGFHTRTELAAATLGIAPFLLAVPDAAIVWAFLGWLLLPLAILDWRHLWLPNGLVALLAIGGLVAAPWLVETRLQDRLIGGAAGFAALWLLARLYRLLRRRDGLGAGDAKLLGALGIWFGWQMLPLLLLLASALGIAAALTIGMTRGSIDRTTALPFGSYLAIAGWLLPLWWVVGPILPV